MVDAVSSMHSLSVLLSAVEMSNTTRTALELARLLSSEIIRTCVCVPCILAMAAIRAAFILLRVPDCAATIQEQQLFESGVHLKKHRYGSFVFGPPLPAIVVRREKAWRTWSFAVVSVR